jgi:hypothetical protein
MVYLSKVNLILDMPVSEELKRGRFGDALKEIVVEKAQIIRVLVALLTEYAPRTLNANLSCPTDLSSELSEKAFRAVADMLVDEASAREFIPILHCIIDGPNMVFGTSKGLRDLM